VGWITGESEWIPPHSIWGGSGPYPSSYALDAMTVSPGAKKSGI